MSPQVESNCVVRAIGTNETHLLDALMDVFGEAFEDVETYGGAKPTQQYAERLLGSECFVTLVALDGDRVVGGLTAYELMKPERSRSEMYVYDLAVSATHRRRGIATALMHEITDVARDRGAWVVFVQADKGDDPAIALYSKLGTREDVLHFDITTE